ncbi:MAG: AgmX/PglI C-terminal domain-containing protein [Myxococcales bacterium]|nr:AgmX/PglI C-terminal domain-containing protein [Myxococcales bacterium]
MATQTVDEQLAQALIPPPELSKEEKWIVRIHGKDLGPFSSQQLYPKILQGEIEPDSLLLDQEKFSRSRLRDLPEFQPYIHLHNTQNPILLEEKRRQEKDRQWEETGRKRAILLTVSSVMTVVLAVVAFFMLRKSDDAYLTDGDHVFQLGGSFAGLSDKKARNWELEEKKRLARLRRTRRASGGKSKTTAGGGTTAAMVDFESSGGGGGIPQAEIRNIINRKIRGALHCFKSQMERDSRFDGCSVQFTINGSVGKITNISFTDTDYASSILQRCVKRSSSGWNFPKFPSTAIVSFPVHIQRRTRW